MTEAEIGVMHPQAKQDCWPSPEAIKSHGTDSPSKYLQKLHWQCFDFDIQPPEL
jgi:hypothetical protein